VTQRQVIQTAGNALWISPLTYLEASFPGTGGWIDGPNQRLEIRHVLPLTTPADLARVTVEGSSLRLGDVANVVEGHPPLIGDALLADGPGLLFVIEKLPGANTLDVARGIEAALAELRPGLPGVEIDASIFRAATFIETGFGNLKKAMVVAAVLGVIILALLLYDWRAAAISIVVIPVSLVAATALVGYMGGTLNTMVLAGLVIAVAVVVDDAVLGVDAMLSRRRRAATGDDGTSRVVEAALESRGPMLYATLILLLAVIPVFLMEGVAGAFFRPLALSFALGLIVAMVVAVTVTPALGWLLLRHGPLERRSSGLVDRLQAGYEAMLTRTVHAPRTAFLGAAGLVALGLAVWPWLGQSLLPAFKERHLRIDWQGAPGTSHPAMARMLTLASREIRAIPGRRCLRPRRARRHGRPGGGRQLRSAVDHHRPIGRLRRDPRRGAAGDRRVSRPRPQRAELRDRPHPRGAGRHQSVRRHPHLREETRRADRQGRGGPGGPRRYRGSRGSARGRVRRTAAGRGAGRSRAGGAVRPQAGRRAPGGGDDVLGARRRVPVRGAEGLRRRGLGHARDPQQHERHPQPAARHASRRPRSAG
jgi:hypothetical protein